MNKFKVGDFARIKEANVDSDKIGQVRKVVKIENGLIYLKGCINYWSNSDNLELVYKIYVKVETLEEWKAVLDVWFSQGAEWSASGKVYNNEYFSVGKFLYLENGRITHSASGDSNGHTLVPLEDIIGEKREEETKWTGKTWSYTSEIKLEDLNKLTKKSMLQKLNDTLKKHLPGNIKTQYKAGYRNGDLELTVEGRQALEEIIADKFEAELTAKAQEKITEEEAK
jgi:hypothetical protein